MARTTGTSSLADLVKGGKLQANERIVIRRRSAPAIEGSVQADGSIRVGSRTYATPSKAAREALGLKAADGWIRWRVPRLDDQSLAAIREADA
jgi:hypothetical protein